MRAVATAAKETQSGPGADDAAALKKLAKQAGEALSQHLAKLRADGLVEFRRTSQTLHYRVADPRALRLLQVLKEIYCGELK